MSDYELIMIILEVMTVVIAFGALVGVIGQKVCVTNPNKLGNL